MAPLVLAAIISGLSALGAGGLSLYGQKKQRESEQQNIDLTNEFNQTQYEDWKYYNSLDQRLKRAENAGVSKWAALGLNDSLPQAFQIDNSTAVSDSGLGAAAQTLSQLGNIAGGAVKDVYHDKISKEQRKFDEKIRLEALELQKQQLAALEKYRKATLAQQKWMFGEKLGWSKESFGRSLQFKKDYYLSPEYLGYWDVKSKKQNYDYNEKANPVRLALLNDERLMKKIEREYLAEYLQSRNSIAHNNAWDTFYDASFNKSTWNKRAQAANRQFDAVLTDPRLYPVIQWIDWSTEEANSILDGISKLRNFTKPQYVYRKY